MAVFNVNPGQISADSLQFQTLAQFAQGIHDTLSGYLEELGDFAGNDVVGQQFSAQWNPAVQVVHSLLTGFTTTMTQAGVNLSSTADSYAKANDVNTHIASAVELT
jgi:hypothetical protein